MSSKPKFSSQKKDVGCNNYGPRMEWVWVFKGVCENPYINNPAPEEAVTASFKRVALEDGVARKGDALTRSDECFLTRDEMAVETVSIRTGIPRNVIAEGQQAMIGAFTDAGRPKISLVQPAKPASSDAAEKAEIPMQSRKVAGQRRGPGL